MHLIVFKLCLNKTFFVNPLIISLDFPGGSDGKEPACQCRKCKRLGFDPWVGKIPWRRAWQPTPVFSPGESHGQRSLADRKESDMTEAAEHTHTAPGRSAGNSTAWDGSRVPPLLLFSISCHPTLSSPGCLNGCIWKEAFLLLPAKKIGCCLSFILHSALLQST